MTTGMHVVADINCNGCSTAVGWRYIEASTAADRSTPADFFFVTHLQSLNTSSFFIPANGCQTVL